MSKDKILFPISSIYGSPAELLIFVSDRIARAFIRSGATQVIAHDISKTVVKFSINLGLVEFYVKILAL